MVKGAIALVAAAVAGLIAYCVYFVCATQPMHAMLAHPEGEMEWLRREFELDDAQFVKIKALHDAYKPDCALMCRRIAEANSKVDSLIDESQSVTPEIASALSDVSVVQQECRQKMLAHIYAVSAAMKPENGRRYLTLMKPRLIEVGLPAATAVSANTSSREEAR